MREIKFRCWDGVQIRHHQDIKIDKFGWWHKVDKNNYHLRGDSEGLMQYTGLKDKTGRDIYEGDLVRVDDSILEIKWESKQVGINGWEYGSGYTGFVARETNSTDDEIAGIAQTGGTSNCGDTCLYADDFEVIGNIYECR